MKILLSAYACEPGKGSESGIGWNVARELAKTHEVWVLTRPDEGREAIEAELKAQPELNLHFVYFTVPFWEKGWQQGGGSMQLHYYLWQIRAYFAGKQLQREVGFDLIQHVTLGRYWYPSFLALLPAPFVWGPVGGGESAPRAFWGDFGLKGQIVESIRTLARWLGEKDPFVRLTAARSTLAMATTEETAQRMRCLGTSNVKVVPAVGLPEAEIEALGRLSSPPAEPIRFISIGRLLHWKGFQLGLRAFAQAKRSAGNTAMAKVEYWIIGDGQHQNRLEALVRELEIENDVCFWGALPRSETLKKLAEGHVLVHPSLHDSGGWVCLEMMAAGRPVICLDLGGPAVQVTAETGFKIPAQDAEQAVNEIAQAMVRLANEPDLRQQLGEAAKAYIKQTFNWQKRGELLVGLQQTVVNAGS